MAQPAAASFDSGTTTANASSYTTNSKSFVAGRLYLLHVYSSVASGTITAPTVTLTVATTAWSAITTAGTAGLRALTTVGIIPGGNVTDTVKIDYGAQAITGIDWIIEEVTAFGGATVAAAIVQSAGTNGTSGTPSIALGSAPNSNNLTIGVLGNQGNVAMTAGTGFVAIVETAGHATPSARLETEKDTGTPLQTAAWTMTSNAFIAQALEILGILNATVTAPAASATAAAAVPGPSAGASITAPAAAATGSGAVPSASAGANLTGVTALASATGLAPSVQVDAAYTAPAAAATAAGLAPSSTLTANPAAPAAGATAAALAPSVSAGASTTAPAATAAAAGLVPGVQVDASTTAPAAGATAAALAPSSTLTANPAAPAATATADGLAPTLALSSAVTAPSAGATAQGLIPTPSAGASVTAPRATATAQGLVPAAVVFVFVTAPAATATAQGLVPVIPATILFPVTDSITIGLSDIALLARSMPVTDNLNLGISDEAARTIRTDVTDNLNLGISTVSTRIIPVHLFVADDLTIGISDHAAIIVQLAQHGFRTGRPRGLGHIRHHIVGPGGQSLILPFDAWEAIERVGDAAAGYISASARIPWELVERHRKVLRYGAIVRSFHVPTNKVVAAGMLLEPAPSEEGADLTIVGWGQALSETAPRRLWQNANPEDWVTRDTPPHNFSVQGDMNTDIQSGKIRLYVPEGTIVNTDDRTGVVFNAQGNAVTRFAGTLELNRTNAGSYTLTVDTAVGPSGVLTQRFQWTLNAGIGDFDIEFENGTDDVLVLTLRYNGAGGGAATYLSAKLTNPRVNGMAVGDNYGPSSVVRDVFALEGVSVGSVRDIGGSILPLDVRDAAKGDPAVRAGILAGAFHAIWDTGSSKLGAFQPWGARTWFAPYSRGVYPVPLARYDRVAVPYLDGVTEGTEVVAAPYDLPVHRTYSVEPGDAKPNQETAHQIGAVLAPYLVEQHFGGVAELTEMLDMQGIRRSAHLIHAGDDLIVPKVGPLRTVEIRRTQSGPVDVTFDDTLPRVNQVLAQLVGS